MIGAVLMILVQYYAFVKYFNGNDDRTNDNYRNKSINEKYQLPDVSIKCIYLDCSHDLATAEIFVCTIGGDVCA